jgi:tRNA threonylcarbamoyladenosine biosynthesis protein TsaB
MILALDTCGLDFSLCLLKEGKIVLDYFYSEEKKHCEKLVLAIEDLLAKAQITYSDLTALVITKGPGSFNGIRIGYSAASAIALVKNIPLFSFNSLVAIFYQALNKREINFPVTLAYLLDKNSALRQNFSNAEDTSQKLEKVDLMALQTESHLFSLGDFSWKGAKISKAAAVGLAFFANKNNLKSEEGILYGKEPSIDKKLLLLT